MGISATGHPPGGAHAHAPALPAVPAAELAHREPATLPAPHHTRLWLCAEVHDGRKVPQMQGENGAPEEIRTPSLLIRSQMLYPVELRAHSRAASSRGPAKRGAP